MIRKKKMFVRPKKAYEKTRIEEENTILNKYGLKNKREIWKALANINYFRSRAKDLARSTDEEQKILFESAKTSVAEGDYATALETVWTLSQTP